MHLLDRRSYASASSLCDTMNTLTLLLNKRSKIITAAPPWAAEIGPKLAGLSSHTGSMLGHVWSNLAEFGPSLVESWA